MREDLKFVTYLLLNKRIEGVEKINEFVEELLTYLPNTDKLYIFNSELWARSASLTFKAMGLLRMRRT